MYDAVVRDTPARRATSVNVKAFLPLIASAPPRALPLVTLRLVVEVRGITTPLPICVLTPRAPVDHPADSIQHVVFITLGPGSTTASASSWTQTKEGETCASSVGRGQWPSWPP